VAQPSSELALVAGRAASACFAVSFALDIGDIAVGLHVDPLDFAAGTGGPWPAAYVSQHTFELTAYGLSIAAVLGFFRLLHELLQSEHAVWLVPLRDQEARGLAELWKLSDRSDDQPPPGWVQTWLRLLWIWAAAELLNLLIWPRGGIRLELLSRAAHVPVSFLGTLLCQRLVSRASGEDEEKRTLRKLASLAAAPAPAVQFPQPAAPGPAPARRGRRRREARR
jgi:hypothetical protein